MLIWFCVFNPIDDTAQHDMSQSCIPSSFVITLSTLLASLQFDTTMQWGDWWVDIMVAFWLATMLLEYFTSWALVRIGVISILSLQLSCQHGLGLILIESAPSAHNTLTPNFSTNQSQRWALVANPKTESSASSSNYADKQSQQSQQMVANYKTLCWLRSWHHIYYNGLRAWLLLCDFF